MNLLKNNYGGNMKQFVYLLTLSILMSILIGCGGSESISSTDEGDIPEWYLNHPEDPNYLFDARTAASRDMQLAVDKASADARAEIGRQVETKIQGMQKRFTEEIGSLDDPTLLEQYTQVVKTVVSLSLSGSKVIKKDIVKDGNNYRAYTLVQYPVGAANDAFVQQVKKHNELYTRFRSSEAFKELEEEVSKE
jgi:hypothetical protein